MVLAEVSARLPAAALAQPVEVAQVAQASSGRQAELHQPARAVRELVESAAERERRREQLVVAVSVPEALEIVALGLGARAVGVLAAEPGPGVAAWGRRAEELAAHRVVARGERQELVLRLESAVREQRGPHQSVVEALVHRERRK